VEEISMYAVDTAKNVFQVHGEDVDRQTKVQKRLRRGQLLAFFAKQAPAVVVLEACGSAHYWARELARLGHEPRLIPPQHVKPFLKRNKNDARDAEAIFEAALRPGTRFVPVKPVDQQCDRALHRGRDLLVRQRTQLGNAIRSLLSEMGIVAAQGAAGSAQLHAKIEAGDQAIPPKLLAVLQPLLAQWRGLHAAILALEDQIGLKRNPIKPNRISLIAV
jgi:transposase